MCDLFLLSFNVFSKVSIAGLLVNQALNSDFVG